MAEKRFSAAAIAEATGTSVWHVNYVLKRDRVSLSACRRGETESTQTEIARICALLYGEGRARGKRRKVTRETRRTDVRLRRTA